MFSRAGAQQGDPLSLFLVLEWVELLFLLRAGAQEAKNRGWIMREVSIDFWCLGDCGCLIPDECPQCG